MAFAYLTGVSDGTLGANGGTTSSTIDTTGADLLILAVCTWSASGAETINDSQANAWTLLHNDSQGTPELHWYYCISPNTNAAHDFTCLGTNTYPVIAVSAYTGTGVISYDQKSTAKGSGTLTIVPGSLTAGEDDCLHVCCQGHDDTNLATVDTGFTEREDVGYSAGVAMGIQLADLILSSAAAKSPTMTGGATAARIGGHATFTIPAPADVEIYPLVIIDGQEQQMPAAGYTLPGAGGGGDVSAAAVLADNAIIRGDGGVKGVQDSTATLADTGALDLVQTAPLETSGAHVPVVTITDSAAAVAFEITAFTAASGNLGIGTNAGVGITSGTDNTFIGNDSGNAGQLVTAVGSNAFGHNAVTTTSYQTVIGHTDITRTDISGAILNVNRSSNTITGSVVATIAGGSVNTITTSTQAFIGGGWSHAINLAPYGVIAGGYDNSLLSTSTYSSIVGGYQNIITTGTESFIGGGIANTIHTSDKCFIGGGANNDITATSDYSTVCGGSACDIDDSLYAFIGGGNTNKIADSGDNCTIGGGTLHDIDASTSATIAGGYEGQILVGSNYAAIGGGLQNTVTGSVVSTICGGNSNTITTSDRAVIAGGTANTMLNARRSFMAGSTNTITAASLNVAQYSVIAGGFTNSITDGAYNFIGSGSVNEIDSTAVGAIVGGWANTITTGSSYGFIGAGISNGIDDSTYSAICGGNTNTITDSSDNGFIGSGRQCDINTGTDCAVVSGYRNDIDTSPFSFIGTGANHKITDTYFGAICGGDTNTIVGGSSRGFIGAGWENDLTAAAQYSSIVGGAQNEITDSLYAVIDGGGQNYIASGADYARACGHYAVSNNHGEDSFATGRHDSTSGSAQRSDFVIFNTTADATWTNLYTNGTSTNMLMPANSCWTYEAQVAALETDGSAGGGYSIRGVIRRDGAAGATVVATEAQAVIGEDTAAWGGIRALASGNNLLIQVQGAAGTDINWTGTVRVTQVIVES